MKKALLLIVFSAILIPAKAEEAGFQLGLKFDPNLAWLSPQIEYHGNAHAVENDGIRLGFSAGLVGDFNITKNYAFATEVRFSRQNGRFVYEDVNDNIEWEYGLNMRYIELPIGLKLKTNEIGLFTFFGRFSIVPGMNINRRGDVRTNEIAYTDEDGNVPGGEIEDVNLEDELRIFRAATEFSLGTQYRIAGNTSIKASIAYNNGFSNLIQSSPSNQFRMNDLVEEYELSVNSSFIALNLALLF